MSTVDTSWHFYYHTTDVQQQEYENDLDKNGVKPQVKNEKFPEELKVVIHWAQKLVSQLLL